MEVSWYCQESWGVSACPIAWGLPVASCPAHGAEGCVTHQNQPMYLRGIPSHSVRRFPESMEKGHKPPAMSVGWWLNSTHPFCLVPKPGAVPARWMGCVEAAGLHRALWAVCGFSLPSMALLGPCGLS